MIDFLKDQKVFVRKRPLRFNKNNYYNQTGFLSYDELKMNGVIKEGLVATYPVDFTGKPITKMFGDYLLSFRYSAGQFNLTFNENKELSDEIKKKFDACGWFCSVETCENGITRLSFEAKFQEKIKADNLPYDYSKLIHVTPRYNKEKILRDGFSPRCKNDMFEYPGRIYFTPFTVNMTELAMFICQLWNKSKNKERTKEYTMFLVDTDKVGDISFEADKNYEVKLKNGEYVYGVYTTENIKPSAIVKSFDVSIVQLLAELGITEDDLNDLMPFVNLLKNKK